jgi:hypothetical protein
MNGRLLTGLACSGLLALGILLPVQVQAQDAGKKEKQGIIIQFDGKPGLILLGKDKKEKQGIIIQFDGKPGLILVGKERSPNQEVIELLQRALKILSQKGQGPAGGTKADEIQLLKAQIATLRKQMELMEAKLRATEARLRQLQGKGGGGGPLQFKLELRNPEPKKADSKGKGIFFQDLELRFQDGKLIGLAKKKEQPIQREELQNRLNRLLREIEELRRDIERRGASKK